MRVMDINKQRVIYQIYKGMTDQTLDGFKTGEKVLEYYPPVVTYMNVSAARGSTGIDTFWLANPYSRVIVTDDMDTEFDKTTIFYIGYHRTTKYSQNRSYSVGKIVLKDDLPYKCISEVTAGEGWDDSKWEKLGHNYQVSTVSRSINSTTIIVKEVSSG